MIGRAPLLSPPIARILVRLSIVLYCIVIFLVLDFCYSAFLRDEGHSARYPHPVYHHALLPNFDGYDNWGDHRYKFYTDSLGFRDAAVRNVAAQPSGRRVLLMGDSFTEGTGVAFEDSFAGRLVAAGQKLAEPIEFLDAGVISYSPALYLRKIRYLIDQGLRFDEAIVFSDVSDVRDEATNYFCHDDDPRYQAYCPAEERAFYASLCTAEARAGCQAGERQPYGRPPVEAFLTRHFAMTDRIRALAKFRIQQWLGNRRREMLAPTAETAWLFSGTGLEDTYAPLGIKGGIARSLANMGALADLLRQRGIAFTIVVYPWPVQLARREPHDRQSDLWRDFCASRCKAFIDLTPAFAAAAQGRDDWYERLFISGDFHFSPAGHELMFRALSEHLLRPIR
jgi:lysophospholipase L1-like esterase